MSILDTLVRKSRPVVTSLSQREAARVEAEGQSPEPEPDVTSAPNPVEAEEEVAKVRALTRAQRAQFFADQSEAIANIARNCGELFEFASAAPGFPAGAFNSAQAACRLLSSPNVVRALGSAIADGQGLDALASMIPDEEARRMIRKISGAAAILGG